MRHNIWRQNTQKTYKNVKVEQNMWHVPNVQLKLSYNSFTGPIYPEMYYTQKVVLVWENERSFAMSTAYTTVPHSVTQLFRLLTRFWQTYRILSPENFLPLKTYLSGCKFCEKFIFGRDEVRTGASQNMEKHSQFFRDFCVFFVPTTCWHMSLINIYHWPGRESKTTYHMCKTNVYPGTNTGDIKIDVKIVKLKFSKFST